MYSDVFVCDTVNAMGICAAEQPTWHPGKCGCPSVHPLYIHFPYRSFNIYIYIPWSSDVSQRFRKTIVFLVWCLISSQFHQINVCCDFLNSPTLFWNSQGFNMSIIYTAICIILNKCNDILKILFDNTRIHMYFFHLQFLVLSKISHGKICSYNIIRIHLS